MARRVRHSILILGAVALAASACSNVRYYGQAVRGGLGVVLRAKAIDRVLASGDVDPEIARQLSLVGEIRHFARIELGLDVGKRYTKYRDLGRDVVVWNVVAAPELSVVPRTWCFPVAGCVSYRGYFKRDRAEHFADVMRNQGLDVSLGGATAYSTLGWLRDPVLNTFLGGSDAQLAGLLFHELAHATLYAAGDTAFNESFATVVEEVGVRQWLDARGHEDAWRAFAARADAERSVTTRLDALRRELEALYASNATEDEKRRGKTATLERFQTELGRAIEDTPSMEPWRGWTTREINNADLASVGVYWQWVDGLAAHLETHGWPAFIDEMRNLSEMPHQDRQQRLETLDRVAPR